MTNNYYPSRPCPDCRWIVDDLRNQPAVVAEMFDHIIQLEEKLQKIRGHHEMNIGRGWNNGCGCCSSENLDEDYDFNQITKTLSNIPETNG